MTIEEAIEILKYEEVSRRLATDGNPTKSTVALSMAIQALEESQTCENINEDYADCDLFVCSECGIELQDWDRIEHDDVGEISYHEYTFKYCPNCGRRIKYAE